MKKSIFISAAIALSISANAQYSNFSGNSRFCDNWSLGVEGGIQTNLKEFNKPQGGVWGLNLNKNLTPYFGLSIEALAGVNNTGNWIYPYMGHFHNGTAIDNVNAFLAGRWNVTNSLGGFKGYRRLFELETNVGVGYGKFFTNSSIANSWEALLVKAGLNFNFNLGKEKAWTLSIRPAVIWNTSATGKFDCRQAVGQLTAALTYNFKTSNGTHYFINNRTDELLNEIEALNIQVRELQAALAEKPVEVATETIVEKVVEEVAVPEYVDNTFVVNFAWNSAELSEEAKANLNKVPENVNVSLAAYASPEGSKEYNIELSERRAQSVADYLATRNIKVVKTEAYGAVNENSNRIVIVTIQ